MMQEYTEDRKCYMYRVVLREDPSKDYIGISIDPKRRWRQHKNSAKRGEDYHFQRALMKYGFDQFEWKIIAIFRNSKIAKNMERAARQFLGLGYYNMTEGGEGIEGYHHTEKAKKAIGDGNRGKKRTPEQIEVIRQNQLGKTPTQETRAKLSAAHKGRIMSEEQKVKLSVAHTGKKLSEEHRRKIGEVTRGRTMPDHVKEILLTANTGRECSDQTRQKIGEANRGRKHTEEARQKMSMSHTGKKLSPDCIAKLIAAGTGRKDTEETKIVKKAAAKARADLTKAQSKERWSEAKSLGFTSLKQLSEHKAKLNKQESQNE